MRLLIALLALFALAAPAAVKADDLPPGLPSSDSTGYTVLTSGGLGCGDGQFTEADYTRGVAYPPWPWGDAYIPKGYGNRTLRDVRRVDVDNSCSYAVLLNWVDTSGAWIWALVFPHTTISLAEAELRAFPNNPWQREDIVQAGASSCIGDLEVCLSAYPYAFFITPSGFAFPGG